MAAGQGRAILFLRETTADDYRDLILGLCGRDQAFDRQFEDRSEYMCRLVDTLSSPSDLVERLGARLFSTRDRRDRKQIRQILAHFARAGDGSARRLLVRDFHRTRLKDRQFADAAELLGYEGLELLMGQAHRLEDWELAGAYEDAVERFGKRRARKAFSILPQERRAVAFGENLPAWKRRPREAVTAPELIARLRAGKFVGATEFAPVASADDWRALEELALETEDAQLLRRVRFVLRERAFSLPVEATFIRAATETRTELRWDRLKLFESTQAACIRDWAVAQLSGKATAQDVDSAFGLLRLNAERRDRPLILSALERLTRKPWWFHSAGIDVRYLRFGATTEMLQLIYEFGPCELCRNGVVKTLSKRRALTDTQRRECTEDSDEDTRKWARRSLASSKGRAKFGRKYT